MTIARDNRSELRFERREPILPGNQPRRYRQAVFRSAQLQISKSENIPCVVKNLSPEGARIVMAGAYGLPLTATLKMHQFGFVKKARVVWQHETEAGLQFIGDIARPDRKR